MNPTQRAPVLPAPLQGGLDNDRLREAWDKKLPGVAPTDRDLTAFALGVEVGFSHARDLERQDWDRVHHALAAAGVHPGRTDDHLADVIARALASKEPPVSPDEAPIGWLWKFGSESPDTRWHFSDSPLAQYKDRIIRPVYSRAALPDKPVADIVAKRLIEQADHMLENAKRIAKYEGCEQESRARELASCYVRELAECLLLDEKLAALKYQPTYAGWVPVSERLPAQGHLVPLLLRGALPSFGFFAAGKWESSCVEHESLEDVTHWMPLPAAPDVHDERP